MDLNRQGHLVGDHIQILSQYQGQVRVRIQTEHERGSLAR